jgi:hypothetical protein
VRAALLAVMAGVIGPGGPALAQPNSGDIQRERRRSGVSIDANTPLVQRLLVSQESKSWEVRIDLRMPEPRIMGTEIKPEDFISEDRDGFKDPSRPADTVGGPSRFKFDKARLVFPVPADTAGSQSLRATYSSSVLVDDRVILKSDSTTQAWETGLRAMTRLAVFEVGPVEGQRLNVQINAPVTTSRLLYDEAEAAKIDWPASWPEPVAALLQPQYLVDWRRDPAVVAESDKAIDELIKRWLGGADPRTIKPAVLAKQLAGEVLGFVRVSGSGAGNFLYRGDGLYVRGFKVTPSSEAAKGERIPEEMLAPFLTSVYRRAGIPARVVIGLDIEDKRDRERASQGSSRTKWVTWAEFALYDPAKRELAWVPVDLARQRRAGSRPGSMDKPWRFFGNHDELDYLIPLAFQFTPPTRVFVRGAPALWGWSVEPMLPGSHGAIKVEAVRLSSRDRDRNTPQP